MAPAIKIILVLTVLSSRYIVFDKKSIPMVACNRKHNAVSLLVQSSADTNNMQGIPLNSGLHLMTF
jgi:hypothetical protein